MPCTGTDIDSLIDLFFDLRTVEKNTGQIVDDLILISDRIFVGRCDLGRFSRLRLYVIGICLSGRRPLANEDDQYLSVRLSALG